MNDDRALFAEAVKQVAGGGLICILRGRARSPSCALAAAPTQFRAEPRELEILRRLAAGRAMAEIADLLDVSYKTVANNCTQLKQKLGARSAMDLMRIALNARISAQRTPSGGEALRDSRRLGRPTASLYWSG